MFFVRKEDPLEIENKINENKYRKEIQTLRKYYDEFVQRIPSTGKDEVVLQKVKN
jgi:GTP-dependent phosphoenolpyruvate carboxykinase